MTPPKDPQTKRERKQKTGAAEGEKEDPAAAPALPEPSPVVAAKAEDFPIVGVGASAGGLRALEGFFAGVPADCGMAFVVVQHLDPRRESLLKSLLEQYTRLPICLATEGTRVEVGHVYVKAPGHDVVIRDGVLHLQESAEPPPLRHSIDAFLRALADDQGERGMAAILSGTGSDGTLGVRAVHAAGGLVMVQEEGEAEYDGMPRSAIDTGMVDFVLPVARIGEELVRYCQHPPVARR
jgi:two-component system CheB/CheR fusion protein